MKGGYTYESLNFSDRHYRRRSRPALHIVSGNQSSCNYSLEALPQSTFWNPCYKIM